MADYSTSFTKHQAYNVDKATLAEIAQVAKTFLEIDPTISICLQDDHKIEDTNLDALVADTYVRGKAAIAPSRLPFSTRAMPRSRLEVASFFGLSAPTAVVRKAP